MNDDNKIPEYVSEPKQKTTREVSLRGLIGKGYDEFWRTKCRYVVVRGS